MKIFNIKNKAKWRRERRERRERWRRRRRRRNSQIIA